MEKIKEKRLIHRVSILKVYALDEMEDLITTHKLSKILRNNQCNINRLDKKIIQILLKGTEKEIEALSFMVDIGEHIEECIFDCLMKLKSISNEFNSLSNENKKERENEETKI